LPLSAALNYRGPVHPTEQLAQTIRSMSPIQLQNRLMRISAREIAFALKLLGSDDRAIALRALPAPMVARIRDELELSKRRRLAGRDHLVYVRQMLASLVREEAPRGIGSFVRPVRRTARRDP
jgi:Mg/Co/Ni transporter MgtE